MKWPSVPASSCRPSRDPPVVGGQGREGAGDAAAGPDLGVVLEHEEVAARPVTAEHRRQQAYGAGCPVREPGGVPDLRVEVLHRRGDLGRERRGVDGVDQPGLLGQAVRRALDGGSGRPERREVDAAVHRPQPLRAQGPARVEDVGEHVGGQGVGDLGHRRDGRDVRADLRDPGRQPPAGTPGAAAGVAGVALGVGQGGPGAGLVAGGELPAQLLEVGGHLLERGLGLEGLVAREAHEHNDNDPEEHECPSESLCRSAGCRHDLSVGQRFVRDPLGGQAWTRRRCTRRLRPPTVTMPRPRRPKSSVWLSTPVAARPATLPPPEPETPATPLLPLPPPTAGLDAGHDRHPVGAGAVGDGAGEALTAEGRGDRGAATLGGERRGGRAAGHGHGLAGRAVLEDDVAALSRLAGAIDRDLGGGGERLAHGVRACGAHAQRRRRRRLDGVLTAAGRRGGVRCGQGHRRDREQAAGEPGGGDALDGLSEHDRAPEDWVLTVIDPPGT